jgi:hypothetical protein
MTEKHRVPHKLSVASAYRRVAAKFRRRGDHRTTDDYQRATDHSEQAPLRREEAVWRGGLGGGF